MPNLTLTKWERDFRAAAKADDYNILRDHIRFLDLPGKPTSMLRATILMVHATAAYYEIDGRSCHDFLAMQEYNSAKSPTARYMFTFDLWGKAYARLLVDSEIRVMDLADLFNHPWMPYKVTGYHYIWISRTDCTDLTKREMKSLQKEVTNDLLFDYGEDEIDFWFDDSVSKYLLACVQDHEEPEEEDEE
jgi:hypothetical protein